MNDRATQGIGTRRHRGLLGWLLPARSLDAFLGALLLGTALSPNSAFAAGFTVVDGQTVGQQQLTGIGDVGVIEAGGTVATSGVIAVTMSAAQQQVLNAGTISIQNGIGIAASGSGAYIENNGIISAAGGFAITVSGAGSHLVNYGALTGSGNGQYTAMINSATIENYGLMTSAGVGSTTLYVASHSPTYNYGSITATGLAGYAVRTGSDFTNFGFVSSGDGGVGVYFDSMDARLVNNGTISATGIGSVGIGTGSFSSHVENFGTISGDTGIRFGGQGSVFVNAGYVSGNGGNAIAFDVSNSSLILLSGSVIDGKVSPHSGTALTLGPGLNAVITTNRAFETITSANPYVTSGNTVAVLDRAGLVLSDDLILALADGAGSASGTGSTACLAAAADGSSRDAACNLKAWLSAFGGRGTADDADDLAGRAWAQGGVEAGLRIDAGAFSAGGYVSGLTATGEVGTSQSTSMSGGAFGAELGYAAGGLFAKLSASYGLLDIASSRFVADNTVSGGLATATADTTGSFFTPTLTAGADLAIGGAVLTPSLRLRYTHLAIDGYEETGSEDNLVVGDRSLDEVAVRAQVALAFAPLLTEAGDVHFALSAGADSRQRTGDKVTANLLGSDITLTSGAAGETTGGFIGAGLAFEGKSGVVVSGDLEYALTAQGARSTIARASLSAAF